MRSAYSCLALLLITFALPALGQEAPSATAAVCTSITPKGNCEGGNTTFPVEVGKIYGFSQVANVTDKIVHYWFHKDRFLGRVDLPIKAVHYKVWSTVTVSRDMTGPWRLEARDASGTVLASFNFSIH